MYNEKAYDVYVTKDYSRFKRLEGNREVLNRRVEKIIHSINEVGYVNNPILVNEKYEVIDGQGRLEAFKRLNIPVEYIMVKGIGVKECISMNINMENWTMEDFINCYAENGNDNYIKFKHLIDIADGVSLKVIWCALFRLYQIDNNTIKEQKLHITDKQYRDAIERIEYVKPVWKALPKNTNTNKSLPGNKTLICQSLTMYHKYEEVDKERLIKVVLEKFGTMQGFSKNHECDIQLEKIYNKGYRKENQMLISQLIANEKFEQQRQMDLIKRVK